MMIVGNRKYHIRADIKAYNVGCMKSAINYTPRTLEEILCFDGDGIKNSSTFDKRFELVKV